MQTKEAKINAGISSKIAQGQAQVVHTIIRKSKKISEMSYMPVRYITVEREEFHIRLPSWPVFSNEIISPPPPSSFVTE